MKVHQLTVGTFRTNTHLGEPVKSYVSIGIADDNTDYKTVSVERIGLFDDPDGWEVLRKWKDKYLARDVLHISIESLAHVIHMLGDTGELWEWLENKVKEIKE